MLEVLCVLWGISTVAEAQQPPESWAMKMFTQIGTVRTHDFGDIALHAEAEHRFVFENLYKEDVEILSAQSNCGCTAVSVSKKVVKSKERAEIIARVDTSGKVHTGKRKATITVRFSKPKVAEVQLQINAFIRSDVIFNPGVIEFGGVSQGKSLSKTVYLQYNGSNFDWRLTGLKKTNPGIRAEAKPVETPRQQNGKTYQITVTLKEGAEAGYVNDLLRLVTNDGNQSLFIPIHGLVLAPLTAKPSYFQLGVIHPGEEVSKNLVIRGATPFRIEKISSTDSRMKFLIANQESVVHVIPVTFRADEHSGAFHQEIMIKTSQESMPDIEISVSGFIRDPAVPITDEMQTSEPNQMMTSDSSADQTTVEPTRAVRSLRPQSGVAHSGGRAGYPFAGIVGLPPIVSIPDPSESQEIAAVAPSELKQESKSDKTLKPAVSSMPLPEEAASFAVSNGAADTPSARSEVKTASLDEGWVAVKNRPNHQKKPLPKEAEKSNPTAPKENADKLNAPAVSQKLSAAQDSSQDGGLTFRKPSLIAARPENKVPSSEAAEVPLLMLPTP